MNNIDKLAWLRIENRKLLCARSKGKDTFYSPGGKRELGESDQEALIREIQEEVTVALIPASIQFANQFSAQADGKPAGVMVVMTCYFADYTGILTPAAEIEELAWFSTAERNRCSLVTGHIMDWLLAADLID